MDELDAVLSEYQTARTEEIEANGGEGAPLVENPTNTNTTETENFNQSAPAPQTSNWFGNPLYFQSGKKQGQLKPAAKKLNPNTPVDNSDAVLSGGVIDGALFLMLIDLLVPFLIAVLNNRFSDKKIKDSDLQLTKDQQKKLEPLADRVVQMMSMKANPVVLLTLAMTGIYGLNFMAAKMESDD